MSVTSLELPSRRHARRAALRHLHRLASDRADPPRRPARPRARQPGRPRRRVRRNVGQRPADQLPASPAKASSQSTPSTTGSSRAPGLSRKSSVRTSSATQMKTSSTAAFERQDALVAALEEQLEEEDDADRSVERMLDDVQSTPVWLYALDEQKWERILALRWRNSRPPALRDAARRMAATRAARDAAVTFVTSRQPSSPFTSSCEPHLADAPSAG